MHPLERAAFASAYANKKYNKGILRGASGAFGNAATRLASFVVKGGSNVYGSYPDIDELYPLQAKELDPKKREAILDKMQQMVHEKAIYAPIWQLAFISGIGPRVGKSTFRQDRGLSLYGAVRGPDDQGRIARRAGRRCNAAARGGKHEAGSHRRHRNRAAIGRHDAARHAGARRRWDCSPARWPASRLPRRRAS